MHKNKIGEHYFNEFYKSIDQIEYLLDKLEQEEQEGEKVNMVNDLRDKLIKIDSGLNVWVLCEDHREKIIINKLTNILNELTNKSYLTVRITRLSNKLLEMSKMLENCTSCKDKIG